MRLYGKYCSSLSVDVATEIFGMFLLLFNIKVCTNTEIFKYEYFVN